MTEKNKTKNCEAMKVRKSMLTYRTREHNKHAKKENNNYVVRKIKRTKKRKSWDETEYNWHKKNTYLLKRSRWLLHGRSNTKTNVPGKGGKNEKKWARQKSKKVCAQGIDSVKASRLCYKTEPGTLPPDLTSSYSRQQRYQVSVMPLSCPPSVNKSTNTKHNYKY